MIASTYVYKLWMKSSKLYSEITKISQASPTTNRTCLGKLFFSAILRELDILLLIQNLQILHRGNEKNYLLTD